MSELRKWTKRAALVGIAAGAVLVSGAFGGGWRATGLQAAGSAPALGAAQSFAVLGGSAVTNTGSTTVNGELGVWPGSAVTGFPPGTVTGGTIHTADAAAQQAQNAVTTAYNSLAGQACDADLTGQDLGGKTLTPGVYCYSSSAQLTGTVTLNAQGNANAVWVFKTGSTLTTASGSSVLLINGGSPCNVFWQVGSSATLGTTTTFSGSILALTSITLTTGAGVSGRALARNGAVTMDTNNISDAMCLTAATATATAVPATATTVLATATASAVATPTTPATATASAVATPTTPPTATATTVTAATVTATATAATPTAIATATTSPAIPTATNAPVVEATAAPTLPPVGSSIEVVSGPVPVPVALPSTGDSLPWGDGPWVLLLGTLLLASGFLGARRARR